LQRTAPLVFARACAILVEGDSSRLQKTNRESSYSVYSYRGVVQKWDACFLYNTCARLTCRWRGHFEISAGARSILYSTGALYLAPSARIMYGERAKDLKLWRESVY